MLVINPNADYSECGLGKVPYVSPSVKTMLEAAYSGISFSKMCAYQAFLDTIGGADGTIWPKIKLLYFPCFASNLEEAFYELKGNTTHYSGFYKTAEKANLAWTFNTDNIIKTDQSGLDLYMFTESSTAYTEDYYNILTDEYCPFAISTISDNSNVFTTLSVGDLPWNKNNSTWQFAGKNSNNELLDQVINLVHTDYNKIVIVPDGITTSRTVYYNEGGVQKIATSAVSLEGNVTRERVNFGKHNMYAFGFAVGLTTEEALTLENALIAVKEVL